MVTVWRDEDAMTAAETRRRAAGKAALARARKSSGTVKSESEDGGGKAQNRKPKGWDEFERKGLLR